MKIKITVALLLPALLAAAAWGCKPKPAEKQEATPAQKVNFFFTDDLQGEIDVCGCPVKKMGGIARRAKYIERYQDLKQPVLQVDAGDGFFREHLRGVPLIDYEKTAALLLAKGDAKLKVDAVNVGALDFSAGLDFLNELKQKAAEQGQLNLISSNLIDTGTSKPIFETEKVVERNGVKFGIFGLCRPGFMLPGNVMVDDPKATAQNMVKKLKEEQKVDLVVGLFNLGLDESKKISEEIPGIDIVVVSGVAEYSWTPELAGKTILVQAGPGGKYLGLLELAYQPSRRSSGTSEQELAKLRAKLARLDAQMALLDGKSQEQPEVRAKYLELKGSQARVRSDLEKISLAFDYKHLLVPLDLTLPADAEVKGWVIKALGSLKVPE